LLIAGACLAWGIDNNLTRRISAADPVIIAMIKGLVAGSVNLVLALSLGAAFPPLSFAAMAGLLGLLSIGVSLVLFIYALRHLGTARTGAYYSLAPFIGALAAILVLGEPVTLKLLGAAVLMGIGLWIHLAERHAHDHEHYLMEHDHLHTHDEHHQHEHGGIDPAEPHSHPHRHDPLRHSHVHYPDLHHRHGH
jgi:drug/metabolite transporter (DMT)-like permease